MSVGGAILVALVAALVVSGVAAAVIWLDDWLHR